MGDLNDNQVREKRFKHQSYAQTIKEVHLPAAHNQAQLDSELSDNDSHFHQALEQWKQLNLAPSFFRFANKVDSLSASMPLLLHNWRQIVDFWIEALDSSDDEGLKALLDLLQKMAHDLRTTLSPAYPDILNRLLQILTRSISAPALTSLLEALSSLFKYLLIPSVQIALLERTWATVRSVLPHYPSEIQRAIAEVWGSVLRRLKPAARQKAVILLAESAEGVEDASTWVIVFACKSVSQTLHTATMSVIEPLLTFHLSSEAPEATYLLIRRALTALIHHVKNAEQFSPLADLLLRQFTIMLKSPESISLEDAERLRRMLEIVTVPSAVRQGSRLTQSQLALLFSELCNIPLISILYTALLKFSTAILIAAEMPLWLGPGSQFIQRLWANSIESTNPSALKFTLRLNGCLAEFGWGGWKSVALPLLLKMSTSREVLEKDPKKVLGFLALLKRIKKLNTGETDLVWRDRVEKWTLARLQSWKLEDGVEAANELNDILTISSLFSPAVSPILLGIINRTLSTSGDTQEEYKKTAANSAWLLGACMQALVKRDISEWRDCVDLVSWIRLCIEKWGWSHDVIGGLLTLSQALPSNNNLVLLQDVYATLQKALISHSRPLRLNVLRLLGSGLVESSVDTREVIRRCLQGEEVSPDVQGVRERVLRIGRMAQVLHDGDEIGADISARWLIAQFKINLRPLWSPAAGALSSLSERFGDLVWKQLFHELTAIVEGSDVINLPHWMQSESDIKGDVIDPWEEERSWRDPSAHKIWEIIVKWLDEGHLLSEFIKTQSSRERLDLHSYELQLLSALGECSSLAEKHNRELVPHFLALAGPDAPSKMPKHKLTAWLALFAKFHNPKALYLTDSLHTLYVSLLSHSDRTLQISALNCVFTYQSPHILPYQDKIRALMDETRWRDELTSLDFNLIEPQDRRAVVDIIIRLLFGLMLEKKGRSRGADRRAAVLSTLGGCTEEELSLLVDLMLRQMNSSSGARQDQPFSLMPVDLGVSEKHQTGFLTLLGDIMRNLGPKLVRYWPSLIGATIDLIANAQRRIESLAHEEVADVDEAGDVEEVDDSTPSSKITRSIRQLGLKRFADFFRSPAQFDFRSYMQVSFISFISPRLASLNKENTQAPSALLELFYCWSLDRDKVRFFIEYDKRVLPKVYECLVASNVKPAVIARIFDIVANLLEFSGVDENIRDTVVKPHVSLLLSNMAVLAQQVKVVSTITTPLAQRQINILSEIAQYSTDSAQASTLLGLFAPLLRKPNKFVPEKVKVDLLKIIANLMPLIPDLSNRASNIYQMTYELLSQLFHLLRFRPSRLSLISTFHCLATIDMSLKNVATLMESLNAYSIKRMDEPDFDIRLAAFAMLNETQHNLLSCSEWLPILNNMLYFIQDPVELAIRNNASFSMRHFIDALVSHPSIEYETTFLRVLLPGIKNGLRSKNEMVRAEVLGVLAYAVEHCNHLSALKEMKILLADGDEEANFFNNILHIQVHRRSRALHRLAEHCEQGHLCSNTLAEIFIPLVGNYITDPASVDRHLLNDAILTIGRMAKYVGWGAYYALVQKYLKLSRAKDVSERVYVRALVSLLESFHFPMEEIVPEVDHARVGDEVDNEDAADDVIEPGREEIPLPPPQPSYIKQTTRIADAVNLRLLPNLLNHLEHHDVNTDDNTRIPIAIGIVSVAKHLPAALREVQINRLLTILSQILRSKSQETRDLVRDTFNRIAGTLGPSYLPSILRELRAALLRGPQLHILAYITHALLVCVTTGDHADTFDILDDCVSDVSYISAEVIFGESGKDVQAEDFKTKMREVRSSSSKGLDSFAIMAKYITPGKISSLLVPLRSIMQETGSVKVMHLVEEVLKRIASGLNTNKHLIATELLVLCNTLISQNSRFLEQAPPRRKQFIKGDAIVQTKRQEVVQTDHYANNSFRFITFGLELLHTALRRNRFDYRDTDVMVRLEAMVIVVGNTLYSTCAPVLLLGLKCAACLSKCPLKSLEKSLPVFVRQTIDIIQQAGNTDSEVVQVALKSLSTILREGPAVQVKEKDLVFLLEILSPDLEESSRQASVFAMLRAIVARRFVVPEIYDLMDKVSEIMVTNQSPQVQELCRGVLLQFLLDYPQGKGRLRKQMTFFAKNLSYVYESGRKSVMEILDAVISKFEVNLVREYADLLFIALVMVIANDDSAKCREMAAHLIRALFTRLDDEHRRVILSHLHSWASQQAQPQLIQVSSQIYGFIIDILLADTLPYITTILDDLNASLGRSAQEFVSAEAEDVNDSVMLVDLEWQVPYYALTVLTKILRVFPDFSTRNEKLRWDLIASHLLFPHAWVRTASCRLLGLLFTAVPAKPPGGDYADEHPLSAPGMQAVAKKLCIQLKSEHLDDALGLQVVKNLFYIGKCFYAIPVLDKPPESTLLDDEGDGNGPRDIKHENPLPGLFSKLSYQIKSAHIARRNRSLSNTNWSQQPLSVLRWFAAMTSYMDAEKVEIFLVHILTPIYRLVEDDTIRDSQMDELKTLATELQDLLQNKVGTTKFSTIYNQIRQKALGVRRDRRAARMVQVTTNPEAAAKRKLQKNIVRKESRKRKIREFGDRQGRMKRQREN